MSGPELCERTFESDACRQILMTPVAFWEHGAPFARGQGAYGVTFALYYTTGIGVGGNEIQVDALTECFLAHGGSDPDELDGRPDRGRGRPGHGRRARASARFGPAPRSRPAWACSPTPACPRRCAWWGRTPSPAPTPASAAKMRHWKMGLRGSHVTSWLLDRRIDWGSSAFDPLINEAILVYRAFDSWEGTKRYMVDMLGNDTWKAAGQLMEFTYYAPGGPDQRLARGAQHPARRGVLSLPAARAGRAGGLGRRDPARAAAGPQRDDGPARIAAGTRWCSTSTSGRPLDNWRLNRAAKFGQVVGGDFSEDQWILDRMPYRMPLGGLYMSNGVWPVGLSWMAAGYNAAQTIAEDAGVRRAVVVERATLRVVPAQPRPPDRAPGAAPGGERAGRRLRRGHRRRRAQRADRRRLPGPGGRPGGGAREALRARRNARHRRLLHSLPVQPRPARSCPLGPELPPYARSRPASGLGVRFAEPAQAFSARTEPGGARAGGGAGGPRPGGRDRGRCWPPPPARSLRCSTGAPGAEEEARARLPAGPREAVLALADATPRSLADAGRGSSRRGRAPLRLRARGVSRRRRAARADRARSVVARQFSPDARGGWLEEPRQRADAGRRGRRARAGG